MPPPPTPTPRKTSSPGYLKPTAASSRKPLPRAGAIFGGRTELSEQEFKERERAISHGDSRTRRRSPRLASHPPSIPSSLPPAIGTSSRAAPASSPPPVPSEPSPASQISINCPLCESVTAKDIFQHIRRRHRGYPFTSAQFPEGSVDICPTCHAVVTPGGKGLALHRKDCPGGEVVTNVVAEGWRVENGGTTTTPAQATPARPARPPSSTQQRPNLPATPQTTPATIIHPPTPAQPATPTLGQQPLAAEQQLPQQPPIRVRSMMDLLPLPGNIKHLHPALVHPFLDAVSRLTRAYTEEKTHKKLMDIMSLIKVGLVPEMRNGHAAVVERLASFPNVAWPEPRSGDGSTRSTTVRAKEMVENGLVGRAEKVLTNDAKIAPLNENTIDSLRSKHPIGSSNPFSLPLHSKTPLPTMPLEEDVMKALRSFSAETSPGPSGWTTRLISLAMREDNFKTFLVDLTSEIATGTAVGQDILCAARITPLLKPDGGVRPIAVGEMFYRLAMKAIFTTNIDPSFLSSNQFGVGTKGGVEPITRAVQFAIDKHPAFQFTHVVSLDASNAFNAARRTITNTAVRKYAPTLLRMTAWSYNTPTPLYLHADGTTYTLLSSEGQRQGDPMGPLLFSITIRETIEELQRLLGPRYLVLAYFDDIFILGPDDKGLDLATEFFAREDSPLKLNINKCKQDSLDDVRAGGIRLLGTCLGSRGARYTFLKEKIDTLKEDLDKIHLLPRQHALLILRQSLQQKLRHLLRTLKSDDITELWDELDECLWSTFDRIRCKEGINKQRDRTILGLPARLGGIGLLSHRLAAPLAYQASSALSIKVLLPLIEQLEDEDINQATQRELCRELYETKHKELLESCTYRDRTIIVEGSSLIGRKWLSAIPTSNRFTIPDDAIQANLNYRTLLSGYIGKCKKCDELNTVGHNEWCHGRRGYSLSRHESVKHHIASALRSIPSSTVTVEPYIYKSNRRNDIKVTFEDGEERPVAAEEYDLKVVSLLAPSHQETMKSNGRTRLEQEEATAAEREGRYKEDIEDRMKRVLHQQAKLKVSRLPSSNTSLFSPIVISSGGFQEEDTVSKMQEWRKWKMPGISYSWMLTSISVALMKQRGKSFLSS